MNHLILAETQFFAMINGKDNGSTETAYGGFVQEVINLCYGGNDAKHIIVALAFAEIELQHHPQNLSVSEENVVTVYIRKALSFIRKMQKIVSASAITSVPPLTSTSETKATVPALQWTGNAVELVELIYALYATGCINGGKASLKELAPVLYSFFGVESKDCYRFYTDINRFPALLFSPLMFPLQVALCHQLVVFNFEVGRANVFRAVCVLAEMTQEVYGVTPH